jgi:flavin-dependent dehydrogenase
MHPEQPYDVIIVGGRPSGATLAARLGQGGLRVLLVDRATFPSLPAVSSPIIYACTMALLDEIGVPEDSYAYNTPKIRKVVSESREDYRAVGAIPMDRGRDYAYAIDRERFDAALWHHAAAQSGVTAREGYAVIDLIRDESGRVIGIVGKPNGGKPENVYADLVVGADGRWSLVGRKVDAPFYNVHEEHSTSLYYAYWENVAPYDIAEPLMIASGTLDGLGYLMMDSADGTTAVVCEGRTDVIERYSQGAGGADAMYEALLRNNPRVWDRVKDARRVTSVRGLKHTPNYYRGPAGAGWALVGDAAHHKDPLGGQGIYDAVYSAKALAEHYLAFRTGRVSYEEAMSGYKAALEAETLPVYQNTLMATANLNPPTVFQRLVGRYFCENPEFINNMSRVPARMIAPEQVVTAPMLIKTVATGVARDARRLLTGEPSPAAVPPLPKQREAGREYTPSNMPRMGCLGWLIAVPVIMAANAAFPFLRRK